MRSQPGDHGFGIGHLRHALRVDEACHLEPPRTGVDHPLDHLQLVGGGDDVRFVLQAVARADLDNLDAAHGHVCIHLVLTRPAGEKMGFSH